MEHADSDRRRYPRIPTDLDAIAALPGRVICGCSILDMNIYGARIEVSEAVPDEFFLVDLASNVAYKARVAWRSAPLVGTRFLETWLLSGENAPQWLRDVRAKRLAAVTPPSQAPLQRPIEYL